MEIEGLIQRYITAGKIKDNVQLSEAMVICDYRGLELEQEEAMRWVILLSKRKEVILKLPQSHSASDTEIKMLNRSGMGIEDSGEAKYKCQVRDTSDGTGIYTEVRLNKLEGALTA